MAITSHSLSLSRQNWMQSSLQYIAHLLHLNNLIGNKVVTLSWTGKGRQEDTGSLIPTLHLHLD